MFKVEMSEKQLKFLEAALDNMLRSQGLAALQGVVDMTNVLRTAQKVDAPSAPEQKPTDWDNM
jgi:hypothetical protein